MDRIFNGLSDSTEKGLVRSAEMRARGMNTRLPCPNCGTECNRRYVGQYDAFIECPSCRYSLWYNPSSSTVRDLLH